MTDRYGAHFLDVLKQADIAGGDGKLICYGLYGKCPAPPLPKGALKLPKPRRANLTAPPHSGELVDVLHLSEYVCLTRIHCMICHGMCLCVAKLHLDRCSSIVVFDPVQLAC